MLEEAKTLGPELSENLNKAEDILVTTMHVTEDITHLTLLFLTQFMDVHPLSLRKTIPLMSLFMQEK